MRHRSSAQMFCKVAPRGPRRERSAARGRLQRSPLAPPFAAVELLGQRGLLVVPCSGEEAGAKARAALYLRKCVRAIRCACAAHACVLGRAPCSLPAPHTGPTDPPGMRPSTTCTGQRPGTSSAGGAPPAALYATARAAPAAPAAALAEMPLLARLAEAPVRGVGVGCARCCFLNGSTAESQAAAAVRGGPGAAPWPLAE